MRAHRGEQARRDRLPDEHRSVDDDEQLVAGEGDRVGTAQAAPHEHDELAQHDLDAARVDLLSELDASRAGTAAITTTGAIGRDRARQRGQLVGGELRGEIVGEHRGTVRRVRGWDRCDATSRYPQTLAGLARL